MPIELDRHLYGGAVIARLAVLMLGCVIAETALSRAGQPRFLQAQLQRANLTG